MPDGLVPGWDGLCKQSAVKHFGSFFTNTSESSLRRSERASAQQVSSSSFTQNAELLQTASPLTTGPEAGELGRKPNCGWSLRKENYKIYHSWQGLKRWYDPSHRLPGALWCPWQLWILRSAFLKKKCQNFTAFKGVSVNRCVLHGPYNHNLGTHSGLWVLLLFIKPALLIHLSSPASSLRGF